MSTHTSKVTVHMVSSLDGFIAKPDGNVSWLQSTDSYSEGKSLSEEEITAYLEKIDCYVMGSKTYEQALTLGWPYGDKPVIVLTKRDLTSDKENVSFFSGDVSRLINNQLKIKYNNIWMVGGANLTKQFLQLNLVDDLIVSIMPIILGEGTLFFDYVGLEKRLHLKDVTAYKDGMVEMCYEIHE